MKSLIVFLAMFAFASAANFDMKIEPENEVAEKGYPDALARLFVNGLNSTMLVMGAALLAGLLFFALYAATPAKLASQRYENLYEKDPYSEGYYYGDDAQYQTRYKRSKFDGNIFVLIFHTYFFIGKFGNSKKS